MSAKDEAKENVVRHKKGGGHVEAPHTFKENGVKQTVKTLREAFKKK